MYYLLDNNLIINKNDKRIKNLTYSIDKTETYIYLECDNKTPEAIFNCQEYYYATKHLVIKQSENVFDLIQKGDLIKIDYTNYPYSEDSFYIRFVDDMTFKGIHCNEDVIVAIYKPNSKGDYIKVWEVVIDDK